MGEGQVRLIGLAIPWALAFAPLPLLAWYLLPPARERGAVRVPRSVLAHLRHQSVSARGSRAGRPRDLLFKCLGWAALIIALAGPFVQRPAVLAPTGRDVIVALDLSASMAEEDMMVGGRKTARIDVIRGRLAEFLQDRKGDRVALIGFATDAFLISPLTFDVVAVSEMLHEVSIGLPGRKTDLGRAIGLTLNVLQNEEPGERLLVLISDGEANAGELAAKDAAALAKQHGIKIFSIGFAAEADRQNSAHLAELATITGGQFHAATSPSVMRSALAELDVLEPVAPEETAAERRQDWRWLALAISLACFGLAGWQEFRDP